MEKITKKKHRIVVIGPESTGKTTLCRELAAYYNAGWMPEYARDYIEKLSRPYVKEDVLHIAKKQIQLEEEYAKNNSLLFLDTDLIITKVWLLHVYGTSPIWIDEYLKNSKRSIYLVCKPDLPWEFDPVRENPDLREYLMNWYCQEIESFGFLYAFVSGVETERTKTAIKTLQNII